MINVIQRIEHPISKVTIDAFLAPKKYYRYLKSKIVVVRHIEFKKEEIDYIDVAKWRLFLAWEGLEKKTRKYIKEENLIAEFKERWRWNVWGQLSEEMKEVGQS